MRSLRIVAAIALLIGLTALQPAAAEVNKSKNVTVIAHVKYEGGSHLTFGGRFAYAAEWDGRGDRLGKGGVHIIDIKGKPREVGYFHCPANDTDVAFIRKGLIAVGHHEAECNPPDEGEDEAGVFLVDVKNPKKARLVGQVNLATGRESHSITRYPGKPLVYSNAGGLPTNGETYTHMINVSNPRKPKVVGEFRPPAPPTGCHDFSFHFDKRGKFGICSGLQGTQIWDVSKPLKPTVVSTIYNPLIQFSHYSVASKDGKILVINDENITANDCVEQDAPTGAIWVYDISDIENPQLQSYFGPKRGNTGSPLGSFWTGDGTCTSHDFNFVDNRTVVVPWYTGGFNVVSLKDPASPEEVAYYQADNADMWSAHFYKGRIYTNDTARGFEAFKVKGI